MKMLTSRLLVAAMLVVSGSAWAQTVPEEVIQKSFHPYKDGVPSHTVYKPGVAVNQGNVDQFKDILDEGLYFFIKDGWVEVETAPATDFPLSADYIEATRKNAGSVKLNANGTLDGFVAGRAFRGHLQRRARMLPGRAVGAERAGHAP